MERGKSRGFALVVTISLMVLLSLLAVGLLGLSTVSLRSSSQSEAMALARANARLSLVLALGQLQKHAGDDRRITRAADQIPAEEDADSSAAAAGRRFWSGVYDAWDSVSQTRPEPKLRTWLVSGPGSMIEKEEAPTSAAGGIESVRLVGPGTAGIDERDWVEAPLMTLRHGETPAGRFGWWTGDEGLKAMLATPPAEEPANLAAIRSRLQAAAVQAVELASTDAGDQPFSRLDRSEPRLAALTDWPQAALMAGDPESPRGLFHDVTTRTSGLLVNVRRGGFRRDLSMELEKDEPDVLDEALYTLGGRASQEKGINFEELHGYYKLRDELQTVSGTYTTGGRIPSGTRGLVLRQNADACRNDPYFHFKMPVVVSYQAVFSLKAQPVGATTDRRSRLHFVVDPILTFWNPLDVPVVVPTSAFFSVKFWSFPYTMTVRTNGGTFTCPLISSLSGATTSNNRDFNYLSLRAGELDALVFKPGEVIKVSQSGNLIVKGNGTDHNLQGRPGFNFGGGVSQPLRDQGGRTIEVSNSETVHFTLEPNGYTCGQKGSSGRSLTGGNAHTRHFSLNHHEYFVGTDRGANSLGIGGIYIDYDFGNKRVQPGSPRVAGTPGTKSTSDRVYANQRGLADVFPSFDSRSTRPLPVSQLLAEKAPVMMYSYQVKTETASATGGRSMLRFNPRAHHVDLYDLSIAERDLQAYELVVEPLQSWVNRKLETSASGNAYFGGGYDAADGNSLVVTHSVPREPLNSLAALQHSMANGFLLQKPQYGYATLNGREPMLPQISHAIGNSFGPGVLSPYATSGTAPGNRPLADHSYLANLALWDDWFFSSIAPQDGPGFSPRRAQRQVAEEFFNGEAELPITSYKPDLGDHDAPDLLNRLLSRSGVTAEAAELVAAHLRVEGMFNINSTSVQAWRSILSGLLGESVATISESGGESLAETDEGQVPVAGLLTPRDLVADGDTSRVSDPEQWAGRRVLSEEEISLLAEAIVREVRLRGPFLSLADFINRRPESDAALARAGAIQNALDSEEVPINEAYNHGDRAVEAAVAARLPFPEAEAGAASAGIPGIVKQADILTPIAPILTARSDTFLIRGYGEALDRRGNPIARAWCEALVQREADFIDPADERETPLANLTSPSNQNFGRRFQIISFRWLAPQEI